MSTLFYSLQHSFLQPFYDKLRRAALQGMGYGNAAMFEADDNGEGYFLSEHLAHEQAGHKGTTYTVFDVGAHNGKYCKLLMERLKKDKLRIFAFEPDPGLFAELTGNTAGTAVQAVNKGLSDSRQTATLYTNFIGSGAYSLHYETGDASSSVDVELVTLDAFCGEQGISSIDFLKMDCEGHELSILKGAADMLAAGSIRSIQFEFSMFNVLSRTYFRDFWNLLHGNYNLFRLTRKGLVPIPEYNYDLEVFRGTNYIALLKA
jgi:FkbM family methyltransferase